MQMMDEFAKQDIILEASLKRNEGVYLATADELNQEAKLQIERQVRGGKKDVASIERGQKVYQLFGCMACHSVDGTTAGKTGPSWKGLFGSMRPIRGKKPVKADDAYLRKSIVDPAAQIVDGFEQGMPPYLGILSDADVVSLVLYIRSL